ncbi:hypothetical protein TNIN_352831 [Trichonephila inaurata madagascariensis]|uniref:Uncharacterized protein n=1 Tax=Trichonephila inaurata madagascariensis TaxID=2747483 RepID=A0A8X7CKC6_9ARAC|nr:hypothetical protein TNIN_352831 [Trichonephila inaurata madagascariensis]
MDDVDLFPTASHPHCPEGRTTVDRLTDGIPSDRTPPPLTGATGGASVGGVTGAEYAAYTSPYTQYSPAAYGAYGYGSSGIINPSYYYTPSAARSTTGTNSSLAAASPISPNNFKAERC